MNFSERLKEIRKKEGLSQEQLSERIGVSRQAITKWETGKGMPDIENMIILAEIFKISIDELVTQEVNQRQKTGCANNSEIIYDIDEDTQFDIRLIRAKQIFVGMNDCEKLSIRMESDTITNLSSLIKMKMLDAGKRMDVRCVKNVEVTDSIMEQDLYVNILLPNNYCTHCELSADTENLKIEGLDIERFEYDGRADSIVIVKSRGSIEFAGTSDYDIVMDKICGQLEIAQIKANTSIRFLEEPDFCLESRKRKVKVFWEKNEEVCEPYFNPNSENKLIFNGIKSELIIRK